MVRARSGRPRTVGGGDAHLASLLVITPSAGLIRSELYQIMSRRRIMSGSGSILDQRDLGFNSRSERGSLYMTRT